MEVDDGNLWRLWPLSEVDARKADVNDFGALFASYLVDSWGYRVKGNDANTSVVYVDYFDGRACVPVARTLEHFFDQYLANADRLLTQPD